MATRARHAPVASAAGTRRTQAERSAATRARLLDATLACLAERGYAGTTTTEVARRAGLSRGAQLHHYPTRQELVVAAIEHLSERRMGEFQRAARQLPPDAEGVGAAIDLMWSMFSDGTADALLELLVAARSDAVLRDTLVPFTERLDENLTRTARALLGDAVVAHPRFRVMRDMTVLLLQGMAVDRVLHPESESHAALLDFLKQVGRDFLTSAVAPAGAPGDR